MQTSAPGTEPRARRARGFTLLELLVVVAIIALASAGVALALRDSADTRLERDAQRLAALLEAARAQSRFSGLPVRWRVTDEGFRFEGLTGAPLPEAWLHDDTRVQGRPVLLLGPEPIIAPQAIVLTASERPDRTLRVSTDGLRPFSVSGGSP